MVAVVEVVVEEAGVDATAAKTTGTEGEITNAGKRPTVHSSHVQPPCFGHLSIKN